MMIQSCPVHGESNMSKETMGFLQAQTLAYAFNCFLFFQFMAKMAKSQEDKNYY